MSVKEEISFAGLILRWGLIAIAVIGMLAGVTNMLGFWSFAYFAPKIEQVRYNTFKESQAYNDGMLRDLYDIQRDYLKADANGKASLRAIAIHRFSTFPVEKMPADLKVFYVQLKEGN